MSDDEFNLFAYAYGDDEVRTVDFLALMDVQQLLVCEGVEMQLQRRQLYLQMGEDLLSLDSQGTLWREIHENLFKALPECAELSMGSVAGANFLKHLGKLEPRSQLKFIVAAYERLNE